MQKAIYIHRCFVARQCINISLTVGGKGRYRRVLYLHIHLFIFRVVSLFRRLKRGDYLSIYFLWLLVKPVGGSGHGVTDKGEQKWQADFKSTYRSDTKGTKMTKLLIVW